jgi:hypothetical protein
MADATGEAKEPLRVGFDRRRKLEFHEARITSEAACSPTASSTTPSG